LRCILIFLLRFRFGKTAEPNTGFVGQKQANGKRAISSLAVS